MLFQTIAFISDSRQANPPHEPIPRLVPNPKRGNLYARQRLIVCPNFLLHKPNQKQGQSYFTALCCPNKTAINSVRRLTPNLIYIPQMNSTSGSHRLNRDTSQVLSKCSQTNGPPPSQNLFRLKYRVYSGVTLASPEHIVTLDAHLFQTYISKSRIGYVIIIVAFLPKREGQNPGQSLDLATYTNKIQAERISLLGLLSKRIFSGLCCSHLINGEEGRRVSKIVVMLPEAVN